MNRIEGIPEIRDLLSWIGKPGRSPQQIHGLNESDAEVLRIRPDLYLATTTDSLSEEWQCGLYKDPCTLGWMTAMASLSDLAAVGADPLGVLLAVDWPEATELALKKRFADGFRDALEMSRTYWLGGDSGHSIGGSWVGTALGLTTSRPMSRLGLMEGQTIGVVTAAGCGIGIGPALGQRFLRRAADSEFPEHFYRPRAYLEEGKILRTEGVRTCIDTSDGLLTSLWLLSQLNGGRGFELDWDPGLLDPRAKQYFETLNLPLFALWAYEHGDYQLLFSADEETWERLKKASPHFKVIGRVIEPGEASSLRVKERHTEFALSFARDILNDAALSWEVRAQNLMRTIGDLGLP